MWLKRLLGRDDTSDEAPQAPPEGTPPDAVQARQVSPASGLQASAPLARQEAAPTPISTESGAASEPESAASAWPRASGIEVSPPDHAPQGLAAEAGAPEIETDAQTMAPEIETDAQTVGPGMPATNETPSLDMEQPALDEQAPMPAPTSAETTSMATPRDAVALDLEATARHAQDVTADAAAHAQDVTAQAVAHAQDITTAAAERATEVTDAAVEVAQTPASTPEPAGAASVAALTSTPAPSETGDVTVTARPTAPQQVADAAQGQNEEMAKANGAEVSTGDKAPTAPMDASLPGPPNAEAVPEAPDMREEMPPPAEDEQTTAQEITDETDQAPAVADEEGQTSAATAGSDQEAASEAVPDQEAATETVPVTGEEPAAPATDIPPAPAPLAPGAVVAERYTIAALLDDAETGGDTVATYRATDSRSYEQCWSCGNAGSDPGTRFCQRCGAAIQNHPVTLEQTRAATGLPGEVEQDGAFFHVRPERRRFGAEGIGVEIGAHSAEGPHHPNEDSYWYTTHTLCANSKRQGGAVVVFADGMGGYAPGSGLISSRIAAIAGAHIAAALADAAGQEDAPDAAALEDIMRAGIAEANHMVLAEIARTGEMGATLVIAVIYGETCYVANVGDSRAYYVDPHGTVTQITRDQSLVAQEVAHGRLEENAIYTAIGNNIILHAIGEEDVEQVADIYPQSLEPGSYIALCSDGYWKTMRGLVLPEDLFRDNASLSDAARALVDDALAHDSDDNTTVVLVGVS